MNNLVGDVKANPKDFYWYINSQKKDAQGIPPLKKRNGSGVENVDTIKYLGVTITFDLRWNTHISNIWTEDFRTIGFLRRTLFSFPQDVEEAAYKGMVGPILEYVSSVWDPYTDKLQEELEKVQNRAARFVNRNYVYGTGSLTGKLG